MLKLVTIVLIFFSYSKEIQFAKRTISFNTKTQVIVEMASTDEARAQGLMYRESLSQDTGMLFIFPNEQPLSFWMKNTYISLSIGFFDKERKLFEILDMEKAVGPIADSQLKRYVSSKPGKYALEVNQGWFKKHKIKVGDQFQFVGPRP